MKAGGSVAGVFLVWACAAAAGEHLPPEESVPEFMERYEIALDRGDVRMLRDVYERWGARKEAAFREYFRSTVAEFDVEFADVEVQSLLADTARVRFRRLDRFTDVQSGSRLEKEIRLVKRLRKRDGRWRVADSP